MLIFICSWLLYELPGFQGQLIALEEGSIEQQNLWAGLEPPGLAMPTSPKKIGSIRLAVRVSDSHLATSNFQTPANVACKSNYSISYFYRNYQMFSLNSCPCKYFSLYA